MKIGIVPNFTREKALPVTENTVERLIKLGIDYVFDEKMKDGFPIKREGLAFTSDLYKESDLIIAIGGDGSFIHCAKQAAIYKKPVLCINAGNLAFLAGVEGNELNLLEKLITGEYVTDRRMMLEVLIKDKNGEGRLGYCLNDAVVARGAEIKLLDLNVYCDKRKINSYRADGVVVSTPTGSTAYAWSAGGPVIDPNLQCIMLTPICTHSPLNRSLVFNEKSELTIEARPLEGEAVSLSTDGEKAVALTEKCDIIIKKSDYYAEFIRIKSDEFFDILNSKLTQRRA